jgi:hypothetical protein
VIVFVLGNILTDKDMGKNELTWRDVQRIVQIADNLCNSLDYEQVLRMGEKGYYTEILNRFNNTTN